MYQLYLIIIPLTTIKLKRLGAVYHLIPASQIRVSSTKATQLRSLPLRAVILIAALAVLRSAEGARQDTNEDDANGRDA